MIERTNEGQIQIVGRGTEDRFRRKHSLSGVISCLMALAALILWLIGYLGHKQQGAVGSLVLAVAWAGMISFCLIGLGLAIHGVIPRRRRKIYPMLGLLANPLVILLFLGYLWWPSADTLVAASIEEDYDNVYRALNYHVDVEAKSTLPYGEIKTGATAMTAASSRGLKDMVEYLVVEWGAKVDEPDKSGERPLYYAVAGSHTDVVEYLLKSKADPNIKGPNGYVIQVASRQGHQAILGQLLKYGALVNPDGESPLYEAALLGHNGIARLLLDAGASVEARNDGGRTALHAAASRGHVHVLRLLLDRKAKVDVLDDQGVSALELALEAGHDDVAKMLIEAGAPIDIFTALVMDDYTRVQQILAVKPQIVESRRKGRMPLHEAVRLGQLETAKLLLDHKADPKAVTEDEEKITPMMLAVTGNSVEMVKLLLDHGADVNNVIPYKGNLAPPLYYAVIQGNVKMANLLLDRGADVNAFCETPATTARPIYFAVVADKPDVVQALIAQHAEVDGRKGVSSPTPLYEAVRLGRQEMVIQLLKFGADPKAAVGETTPIALAESRRSRDPLVYDSIVSILKGNTPLPGLPDKSNAIILPPK